MSSILWRWRWRSPTIASHSSGSTSAMGAQASREEGERVRVTCLFSPKGRGAHELGDPQPTAEIIVEREPPVGQVLGSEALDVSAQVLSDLEQGGTQVGRPC